MEDRDVDTQLGQHLSGKPPRAVFRQQTLHDSTAAFIRVRRLRSAWRRAELTAAAILIAGVAFLGGRLSAPRTLPGSVAVAPQVAAKPDGVTVSSELVAWLEAANLFRQLGMEERMARAIGRARSLLPADTATADGQMGQVFAAGASVDNQKKRVEPMGMPGPHPSAENMNQILAHSFGD